MNSKSGAAKGVKRGMQRAGTEEGHPWKQVSRAGVLCVMKHFSDRDNEQ